MKLENTQITQLAKQILKEIDKKESSEKKEHRDQIFQIYKYIHESKPTKYTQNWEAYNLAQTQEKTLILNFLDELTDLLQFPEVLKAGRKPISLKDKIFFIIIQAYNGKSIRRTVPELELAYQKGIIKKKPHFNMLSKVQRDPNLTKYLKYLINISGMPLRAIENDFAVDSSGFSTGLFGRWFDVRLGAESDRRKFMKVHITCGTKTNIISAVNITKGHSADSPQFESLIKETNRFFQIREVSADKAYSSRKNLKIVQDAGAIPFIPFKRNTRVNSPSKNSNIWKKMLVFTSEYPEVFDHHYHKRSNVETVFHMIKRKFGSHLRNRNIVGQINEILAKCLCHNLCILVQELFESGIEIKFKKETAP